MDEYMYITGVLTHNGAGDQFAAKLKVMHNWFWSHGFTGIAFVVAEAPERLSSRERKLYL